MKRQDKGFTLIELLIVIAIIAFIAAAILVAVDPVKRIQDSRDAQRESETQGILDAILKKQVDDVAQYDGEAGTAQVSTATLTGTGGTFGVTINGTQITTVFNTTLDQTASDLDTAIDANITVNGQVTASSNLTVVTITSNLPGISFTITNGGTTGGDAAVAVATPTPNVAGSGIDSDNATSQVVVSTAVGVECDTPASAPACPDDGGSLALSTSAGQGCVADLSGLVPSYLASVPTDPLDGTTPSISNLAIGTNNTGYYINRNASGRITIGACYGEQNNTIKRSR